MTGRRRSARLGGYVGATFLAFPHPVGGSVLDLGWLLAWLSPALLLVGIQGLRPRRAAGVAFLASLAAHACILHWIYVVTVMYGHASSAVGAIAPVGLAAYIVRLLLATGPDHAATFLEQLLQRIIRTRDPKRPGRRWPRRSFKPARKWGPKGRRGG